MRSTNCCFGSVCKYIHDTRENSSAGQRFIFEKINKYKNIILSKLDNDMGYDDVCIKWKVEGYKP